MKTITLLGILDCDIVNYKEPSMTLMFPNCTFKCNKEAGKNICQNTNIIKTCPLTQITLEEIQNIYQTNPITKAIIMQGLEPFDSPEDLQTIIKNIRSYTQDPIIIYTGYTEQEITHQIQQLAHQYQNIIIKYGRYKEGHKPHYDPILGIKLASNNQYAIKIS